MKIIVFFVVSLFSIACCAHCPDQAEVCKCNMSDTECEFTFNVHERFSFVSYQLDEDRNLTQTGCLLFLDANGYHPADSDNNERCSVLDNIINDIDFKAKNFSVPMTLDGVNYRTLLLINGIIPGPTIIVYENQIIAIHVVNHLTDVGITIHWHGMYQRKSVWMDGVSQITQSPIDPDSSFDYIFKAEPAGTHWYHSHAGSQKSDGLFGAFIVRERTLLGDILGDSSYNSVIDQPHRHTLSITDWQRKPEAIHQALSSIPFFPQLCVGILPTSSDMSSKSTVGLDMASHGVFPFWSGLINGKGRKEPIPSNDTETLISPNDTVTLTPLSIFTVERGKRYHFRIIGAISIFAFRFSIDGHKLIAIASDGEYFEPVEVDYIIIHSGETYDFILNANQPGTHYWIRAHTLENITVGEHSARGILTYGNTSELSWTSGYRNVIDMPLSCHEDNKCKVLNCPYSDNSNIEDMFECISLLDLKSRPLPSHELLPRFPPQKNENLHFLNFAITGNRNTVNVNRFRPPGLPFATNCETTVSKKCKNICKKESQYFFNKFNKVCECTNIIEVATTSIYNSGEQQSVGIVISALNASFAHPIHLHGHAFHVVFIGDASSDLDCASWVGHEHCAQLKWKNNNMPEALSSRLQNDMTVVNTAIKKDTIIVPHNMYVVIAFLADNPGDWFMHCHVEEHLLDGMAVVIQEYPPDQHWAPPSGINNRGSFEWSITQYKETIATASTCKSKDSPQCKPNNSPQLDKGIFTATLMAIFAIGSFYY